MVTVAPIETYTELLKRRVQTIRSLTEALNESHDALLARDVSTLKRLTEQQQTLCGEVEYLDNEVKTAEEIFHICDAKTPDSKEIVSMKQELASAESELVSSYKVHISLLRNTRRTVNLMMNVVANESNPYYSPSSHESLRAVEE
jgi:flagellar biosynthesis/type III secretory pathway chaperone